MLHVMTLKLYFMKCPERKIPQCILPFRNFAKFTGKHLFHSLLFNKKETLAQVLSFEFCEISKNTFSTEHLWATASE